MINIPPESNMREQVRVFIQSKIRNDMNFGLIALTLQNV